MASRLQDVILRGLAADQPLATDVAPGTLYFSSDTEITERSDGTTWESYTDATGGGAPALHASTHSDAATDPVTVTNLAGYPGGTGTFLRADATFAAATAAAHASTHSDAASDPVTVTNLAGYPGGATTFLRDDATFAAPVIPARIGSIGMLIDGAGAVITTGVKGYLEVPFGCTIQAVTLLADVSGSIVIDIWKDTYANYQPVVGDSITAAAKPTISAALKSQDTTLTGWTTTITAGDILAFNVDSASTVTRVTLVLKVQAT